MALQLLKKSMCNTLHTKEFLCRSVFAGIFLSLLYSFFSNTLLHQLQSPTLKYPYIDISYWLLHGMKWPDLLIQSSLGSCILDSSLFLFCILSFFYPNKSLFIGLFLIGYFIYYLLFNSYGAHHSHSKISILLIPIPFLFKKEKTVAILWETLRYYTLFIYSCAFLWKLIRGSWMKWEQGIMIIKNNFTPYLYFNPNTTKASFYYYLLGHPILTHIILIIGFLLEGVFIIGFFTKKVDWFLAMASLLLILGFFVIADAFFIELFLLSLPLIFPYRASLEFSSNTSLYKVSN